MTIVLLAVLVLLIAVVIGVAGGRTRAGAVVVYMLSALAAAAILVVAFARVAAAPETIVLPLGIPWLGLRLRIDALAAFFLVVVNLGAAAASVYAIGYGQHERAPHRVVPFYPAFLAGMNLVLLADDAFAFLFGWEFMSLASWALVMAYHRDGANRHAGYVYLVMASFGTLSLLLAFGLLAGAGGGYGFDAMRTAREPAGIAFLVLVLALLGAGSKAGLVPLHVWLPLAHPAAPSHVSALMSGVMTKVAVYGFIRIMFDLVGHAPWWWGIIVLVIAAATAVLGVLYALMQHDLKRLLAYHTVENIGIIFIGLGLALAFGANGMGEAAALALTAGLFHVFNHAVFKSLLFFGAGAVLAATGARDMEHLGGLIHRMPTTALAFLVGCIAISALPPLNGFASEWLLFQAIVLGTGLPQWGLKFVVPAVGATLALSAALAAACFVKAFGITFLGRPRTPGAASAREVDPFSRGSIIAFALLCVAAGTLPGLAVDWIQPVVGSLLDGAVLRDQADMAWLTLVPVDWDRSSYNGLIVLVFVLVSALVVAAAIHRFASRRLRRSPPWDCGFPDADPATQYTAGSFAQPIRRVYGTLAFAARETVDMPRPGDTRAARFTVRIRDLVWEWLYAPIAAAVERAADALNQLQFLTIRRYLTFVFASLVVLLLVLALWRP
ncbi:MAG: hydrogenase 4 subunit B [Alphaproteobacteria bacterium]|nr:hydrogenase 4 subunit B [Alphaproteobacteria bacterium]